MQLAQNVRMQRGLRSSVVTRATNPSIPTATTTRRPKSPRSNMQSNIQWDIHGRHVHLDDDLKEAVINRLTPIIHKLEAPDSVESEGPVSHVDVRLMNTSAKIHITPIHREQSIEETLLHQGQLKVVAIHCTSARESLEVAAQQLERKVKLQGHGRIRKIHHRTTGPLSTPRV